MNKASSSRIYKKISRRMVVFVWEDKIIKSSNFIRMIPYTLKWEPCCFDHNCA